MAKRKKAETETVCRTQDKDFETLSTLPTYSVSEKPRQHKKTYHELLQDPRWQKKRTEILIRDDFECQSCGDKDKTLHIHHRWYIWDNPPWDYPDHCFITLCENCHKRAKTLNNELVLAFHDIFDFNSIDDFVDSLKVCKKLLIKIKQEQPNVYADNLIIWKHMIEEPDFSVMVNRLMIYDGGARQDFVKYLYKIGYYGYTRCEPDI